MRQSAIVCVPSVIFRHCHNILKSQQLKNGRFGAFLDGCESGLEVLDAPDGHVVDPTNDYDDEWHQFEAGEEGVEAGGPLHAPAVQDGETHWK